MTMKAFAVKPVRQVSEFFFFSSRRRHTIFDCDWSSDVCSSDLMKPLPIFGAPPLGLAAAIRFDVRQAPQWALCRDRARYVGEIVAMVVAESPARAEDAVDLVEVEWEPLAPAADMVGAGEAGRPG